MAKPEIKVPIPTIPPSIHPKIVAVNSIKLRINPMGHRSFRVKATIKLSRGPAPKPEPM
jgi:hypothetical protein